MTHRPLALAVTIATLACAGPVTAAPPAPTAAAPAAAPASQRAPAAAPPASQPALTPPALTRFAQARLPPELDLAPGRYVVVLVLTLDATGRVTEATVRPPAHAALAPLALNAARAFEFTPARVGATPVPVRLTYRYTFDVRARAVTVVHVFTLREKGTRHPVSGLTALVEETGMSLTAVGDRLRVHGLAPGRYTLYVPAGEHAEARVPFTVGRGAAGASVLLLERRQAAVNQTVIRAPIEARSVARQSLDMTELARLPGAGGDVLKMVENLPGIARAAFGTGQLVVYGSPPADSLVMLNSLPMWQLYHLGSLYSVIHPDFIERIDFIPAGFDASYGHITGGVIDVRLREQPLTAWHAALDVNVLHAGVIAGGPCSRDGDLQVAFRRSYIDAILGAVMPSSDSFAMTAAPRYYDYQLKWQHRLGARHRFLVFANGTDDEMVVVNKRPNLDDPTFVGNAGMRTSYHGALARWTYDPGLAVKNALALQVSVTAWDLDVFQAMSFRQRQVPVMLRDDLDVRLGPRLKLHAGLEAIAEWLAFKVRSPEPPASGSVDRPVNLAETITTDERGTELAFAPFLSLEWQPHPRLTLVPSLRLEAWRGYRSWTYADPRLAARLKVSDTVTLRLAGGLYQQPPEGQAWSSAFGNPRIGPEAAVHLLGGGEWAPTPRLALGGNLFSKWMFHLAEPIADRTLRYDSSGK
ncbi:MAG TPA: hypothetical protein VGQ83_04195, partial [Polyangia bacterium]